MYIERVATNGRSRHGPRHERQVTHRERAELARSGADEHMLSEDIEPAGSDARTGEQRSITIGESGRATARGGR
ncbi:MAG: hypothetical protein ABEJ76_03530 [Halanaeroarchaeum sp.]